MSVVEARIINFLQLQVYTQR